mmetsp:Transcript_7764/g.23330  ORF Transcript_7764/g.23330 Transcript_7764/m.23330 type:complete len:219 (-) Transcript_7764:721-1377(-)
MVTNAFATVPGGSTNYSVAGPWVYGVFDDWFSRLYSGISTVFGHSIGKASMLWAWTRASQGGGAVANAIYKDNNAEKGGVSMYNLDGSIDSMDDVDYFVWQGIRGSTSWPPRVPTYIATTTPASPSQLTLPIIDGAITSMDPTAMAWPWMKMHMQAIAKRTAILSIGTGAVTNLATENVDWDSYANDVSRAWVASLATRVRSASTFKSIFSSVRSFSP